jgi:hypothetical protein
LRAKLPSQKAFWINAAVVTAATIMMACLLALLPSAPDPLVTFMAFGYFIGIFLGFIGFVTEEVSSWLPRRRWNLLLTITLGAGFVFVILIARQFASGAAAAWMGIGCLLGQVTAVFLCNATKSLLLE